MTAPNNNNNNNNPDYDDEPAASSRPVFTPDERSKLKWAVLKTGAGVTTTVGAVLELVSVVKRIESYEEKPGHTGRGGSDGPMAGLITECSFAVAACLTAVYGIYTGLRDAYDVLSAHDWGTRVDDAGQRVGQVYAGLHRESEELEPLSP